MDVMNKDFGIASIPSNGTRFTCDLLKLDYRHIDGGAQWHDFIRSRKIICPMRDPFKVIKSWRELRPASIDSLWDCYDALLEFEGEIDFWLPIDHSSRDKYLQQISKAMKRKIRTDWKKVGASKQKGSLAEGDGKRAAPYVALYERIIGVNS
jgi:hypothetical protein